MNLPVGFSGGVLAGGRSTRMGTDKAFLRIGAEVLIERQLQLLRETGATELLISGRVGVDYSPSQAKVVHDAHPNAGPLAGLASLLMAASFDLVLILAVDMPAMTSVMLTKILSFCREGAGCVPIREEGFEPLAAVYPKDALSLAGRHLNAQDFSMQSFVRAAVAAGLIQPLPLNATERLYFTNWNNPDDLR